jgi:glutamate formiminotransferase
MQVCIQLARALGERVGRELGLPVYLYEHAASRPERRNLADVRRHPYEVLKETIQSDPARRPDYGPAHLGPAGAVAVGAREPLIAFNAYLDTDDVSIAKAIARQVRQSSGGLPAVKALGLLVAGRAQVSMNIVDYRQTSLHTVMAAVRESAVAYGAAVTHTELVGLTPRAALLDAALECLQLPAAARALILENRLGAFTNNFQDIRFE